MGRIHPGISVEFKKQVREKKKKKSFRDAKKKIVEE